ncbi:MAG: radical SAM protein [Eubacteriales bacterium]|nr:radical SAM protein [Eubacteriales bacterium]
MTSKAYQSTETDFEEQIQTNMKACRLCPRACGVDRMASKTGICKMGADIYAARAALHMWEEPCISGSKGSGAVFFSGCNLHCIFCQNREIAIGDCGKKITISRLADIFLELEQKGAANINLVTATHFVPQVLQALEIAKRHGLSIPVVYNCSGYEQVETLRMLEGYADIYLPDFKYFDRNLAAQFSHAQDYPEIAMAAIEEMVRQNPAAIFDEEGYMQKGVIVRHLILPGHTRNSKAVLRYLYETYGDSIYISVMNQYTPIYMQEKAVELNRRVTEREYRKVLEFVWELGITNGFVQEGETAKESFIPMFDNEGIEPANEQKKTDKSRLVP